MVLLPLSETHNAGIREPPLYFTPLLAGNPAGYGSGIWHPSSTAAEGFALLSRYLVTHFTGPVTLVMGAIL